MGEWDSEINLKHYLVLISKTVGVTLPEQTGDEGKCELWNVNNLTWAHVQPELSADCEWVPKLAQQKAITFPQSWAPREIDNLVKSVNSCQQLIRSSSPFNNWTITESLHYN